MCNVTITELVPLHSAALVRLFEDNNREEITGHFHPFPMTAETAERLCRPSKDHYYGAFWEGAPVGFAMLRGWDEGYSIPSFGMFVDHLHHGKGIGQQLLHAAIREAERLNCPAIRLTVYESNVRGVHMYTSVGFQEVCRNQMDRHGVPDIRIVMSKALSVTGPKTGC